MPIGEVVMGIGQSASLVMNGLVFAYDMYNSKSYKGPPLRNHIQTISPTTGSGTGYLLTGGTEIVNIPTLGEVTSTYCNLQNTGASWCCINFMNYGNAGNIFSGSTLYTYLILYRSDSGYTNGNWMYRYEFNSSGTYQTEAGVHSTGNRTYLGNGWYYAWGTFTTQAATTSLSCYSFSYNYSNFNDKISVAKVCILPGNFSGLHPRYWPDVNTTRSSTQAIYDLTNNNAVTVNSLTYASDGTFSFNGSGNNLSIGSFSGYSTNITCEAWFKTTSGATWKNIVCGPTNDVIFTVNGGLLNFGCQGSTPIPHANYSTTTVNTGAWFHGAATYDGSSVKIYVNGNLESTNARTGSITSGAKNIGSSSGGGSEYFDGTIGSVKIYNRPLTEAEVKQNFNATRGIYGL